MNKVELIREYLGTQGISVTPCIPKKSFLDPKAALKQSQRPGDYPFASISDERLELSGSVAESMSLASMLAVQTLVAGQRIDELTTLLDVCAAPGMKGLYATYLHPNICYYCNDLSTDRLSRLKALFAKHDKTIENMTHFDARFIDRAYAPDMFDLILVDAPCSGEGVALAGNTSIADAWSPAKIKRLQQLQIKILKSSWKLLKPGGRLVYATCTLNKNENERVLKKAFGIDVTVTEATLDTKTLQLQKNGTAIRILPSENSIGFFIAVLSKQEKVDS